MGYKGNPEYRPDLGVDKCWAKAFDDEMLFILMARDFTAPAVIMEWIKLNLHKQPPEKLREAFECALEMIKTTDSINYTLRRLKQKDVGGLHTVSAECHHDDMKACWNLAIPDDAKVYKQKNGNWELVYDKSVYNHDYLRIAFYNEEASEEMRIRVPTQGEAYIEYAIQVLFDGTVMPAKHNGE